MFNWKRNLAFVWAAQFLSIVGSSFAMPFIPFYMQDLGTTDHAGLSLRVAQFAAAGNISICLFSPVWGFLADIYGRRIMILRANFMGGLLIPLMAFAPGAGWLVVIRFFVGVFTGTISASQTLVAGNTPHERRGFAMGTLSSAVYSGSLTGTFLGGVSVDYFGYRNAFFISGLALLTAGALVWAGVREDFVRTHSLGEKLRTLKLRPPDFGPVWIILLIICMIGFAVQFDTPFMPLLVEKVSGSGKAAFWTGIIASMSAGAGILAGVALGWLADRTSPRKIAVSSALLAGLLMIPQALASSLAMLMTARFGMVFFAGGLDPVFQIWLAKTTPDSKRGLFMGWATSAKTFGWFLSALISGSVAMLFGVRAVYLAAALIFLSLIPVIRYAVKKFDGHQHLS
jgi:DHA1 family multidrug resistance protein-like MFS transporter